MKITGLECESGHLPGFELDAASARRAPQVSIQVERDSDLVGMVPDFLEVTARVEGCTLVHPAHANVARAVSQYLREKADIRSQV